MNEHAPVGLTYAQPRPTEPGRQVAQDSGRFGNLRVARFCPEAVEQRVRVNLFGLNASRPPERLMVKALEETDLLARHVLAVDYVVLVKTSLQPTLERFD